MGEASSVDRVEDRDRSSWLPATAAPTFAELTRTGLLLAIEGAAAALGVASLVLGDRLQALVGRNGLGARARNVMLAGVCLGALIPIVALSLAIGRDAARARRVAGRAALRALPVIPLAAYPALLHTVPWSSEPLTYLAVLGAFALLLEHCLVPALNASPRVATPAMARPRRQWLGPLAVVIAAAACYAAYTGYLTIVNHRRFGTGAWDLAIYDNLMFNALHGHPFRSTVLYGSRGGNSLGGHAEYGMLLFLPFYALHPSAETLLVLQAIMMGGAAIPLYLFAATQLPRWQAAAVALAYLLYAPMQAPQFYDFHWLPLATFFLFLLFWAISRRKTGAVVAAVLVIFALREDLAPGVAAIGLYMLVAGDQPRLGAALAASAAVWFGLNKFVIMPAIGSWWFEALYKDLVGPGEKGYGSIMKTMLVNPLFVIRSMLTQAKLEYALQLLVPLAFLPLRRASLALLLIPGVLFTLMTTGYAPMTMIKYQYTTHWIAYLFAASVIALRILRERAPGRSLAALVAMCAVMVSHSTQFGVIFHPSSFVGGILPIHFTLTAAEQRRYSQLHRVIAMIPPDASVSSTDFEAPHLSNRSTIYAIGQDASAAEYLLVGVESLPAAATRQHVHKLLDEHPYGLVARVDSSLFLFRQGQSSPDTAAAIRDLRSM